MKIVVAGGRKFGNYERLKEVLDQFIAASNADTVTIITTIDSYGADDLAIRYADERGYLKDLHSIDWDAGADAWKVSNEEMTEKADACVAFWDGKSFGTTHVIQEARKRNLQVVVERYKATDELDIGQRSQAFLRELTRLSHKYDCYIHGNALTDMRAVEKADFWFDNAEAAYNMQEQLRKTIEIKQAYRDEFKMYLLERMIRNQSCTLSDGTTFWEVQVNRSELSGIEQLPYVTKVEYTPMFYPSSSI